MRDEREVLTREIISQKLIREAKRSMVGSVLMLLLGALALGMLHVMSLYASPSVSSIAVIAEIVLDAIFVGACIFFFVRGALRMSKARHGEFSVVEDSLLDIQEDRFSLWQMLLTGRIFDRSNYVHIFKFQSGKKVVVNSDEYQNTGLDAAAKFSLPGDTFFLVFYKDSPEKIVLLYSSKIYNYKYKVPDNVSPR